MATFWLLIVWSSALLMYLPHRSPSSATNTALRTLGGLGALSTLAEGAASFPIGVLMAIVVLAWLAHTLRCPLRAAASAPELPCRSALHRDSEAGARD